jgi:peroxiredoxin
MQEIPGFIRLHKEFGPQGFSVLGISVDEGGPRVVARLVKKRKINYPVVMADRKVIAAFGNIPGVPTSFLINREGHVVKRYPGYVPHSLLKRDIESVLGRTLKRAEKG